MMLGSFKLRALSWSEAGVLLEKESHILSLALVAQASCPHVFHRAELGTTLSTHDEPVDAGQIHVGHGFQ